MRAAVTCRVVSDPSHGTRYDAVDQRWWEFLRSCGITPVVLPNDPASACALLREVPVAGVLLTGGDDLAELGGDAPERDRTEAVALDHALATGTPVIGVCRGMQVLLRKFGTSLHRVTGHVTARQTVRVDGRERVVNSYHDWGASTVRSPLKAWAEGPDGVVKGIRHRSEPVLGIMWHPERLSRELSHEDRGLFRTHFGAAS